jgi:CRP/FNR family cyclic AMP-dependent transcriptional regulator
MLPHIFVGSSTEAAEHVAAVIQAELSRVATVQIWNQDFFPPGSYVIDTLAEKVNRFDFAILIFAADDLLESRGKRYLVARDNTVLEAGFFLAQLGRMRTFIVAPSADNLKLPSDFSGLTRITCPKELSLDLIRA